MLSVCVLAGCATNGGNVKDPDEESLTWREAKTQAQEFERDLVALVPKDQVLATDQRPEGTLLSCDTERHQWSGRTTVTLIDGADADAIALSIADHYEASDWEVVQDRTTALDGTLMVQLIAPDNEENYIVTPGTAPNELDISSGSKCFTLPEDVYPGGKF